jgi:diguanylate cyclase (GGDEF)-like protein
VPPWFLRVLLGVGLAAVTAAALVPVVLGGVAALPWLGLAALTVPAALLAGDGRVLVGTSALAWVATAAVLGAAVPPSAWPAPLAVLVAATGLTGVLETRRRGLVAEAGRERARHEAARATDPVTGLASRQGFSLAATPMVEAARRQGNAVHVLFVDVAGLEDLAARWGEETADHVLAAAGAALADAVRGTDLAARWDDHLLCVVGPGVGVAPHDLARRVREALVAFPPVPPGEWSPAVTVASASLAPWDAGNLGTLLALGEQELYVRRVLRSHGVGSGRPDAT